MGRDCGKEDASGPNGTVSFQLVQFLGESGGAKSLQANLSAAEIDIVIDGLQKAKERMKAFGG